MASTHDLAVVIAHGSYFPAEPYEPLMQALKSQGIDVHCPTLPSSDVKAMDIGDPPNYDAAPPPGGFPQPADDAVVFCKVLRRLIEEEKKEVILFGHSSGGFLAAYCATPDLLASTRRRGGLQGGVIGIYFCCAFLIPEGLSINGFFQPKDGSPPVQPPWSQFHKHGLQGLLSTRDAHRYFFGDLPDDKARYYESLMTASAPATTVQINDPFSLVPTAYLITEDDLALPAQYQELMISLQAGRPGVEMTQFRIKAGHSPFLSQTGEVVSTLKTFAEKARVAASA